MIDITRKPINITKIMEDSKHQSAGATVLFTGNVRDHNEKSKVTGIYYEAYIRMAKNVLTEIESEVLNKWYVRKFIAIHRIGNLNVNETSLAVAVTAEHRHEAFDACKYAIENIKARTPIWKKEISESGIGVWKDGLVPFHFERNAIG